MSSLSPADRSRLEQAAALTARAWQLRREGQCDAAVACCRQALAPEEAVACYRRAIQLQPALAEAHCILGHAWKDQGKLADAVACDRRTLELKPDCPDAHASLVYVLNFCPDADAQTIYAECRRWHARHAEPLAKSRAPHRNAPSPDRRLRIGYVSPDFRFHPVGRFLLPLLAAHDHERCEIFCYATGHVADALTERCRVQADVWREVQECSDEELADLIRQDGIDVLVDLTMHMANNRLLVFARKPAPVQVTYLAYCGTTGLRTMDYRLTDPYLDPPGQTPRFYAEESVWFPETYWCYQPVIAPRGDGLARVAGRTGHFRLPEQLLQSHGADAGGLGSPAAGGAGVAFADPCPPRPTPR